MKKFIFLLCLLCTFFSLSTLVYAEEELDQIIAVVNDDVITKSELTKAVTIARGQLMQENPVANNEKDLQKQVLDQLINKKLQLQMAKQANIKVTDDDLDGAIKQVAQANNMSTANLYERVEQEGMSKTDYRNEIREQMTLQKLQQQEVISKINISPEEVDRYIKSNATKPETVKEYLLEDILIPINDNPSQDEINSAKKRAETIVAKIKQGNPAKSVVAAAVKESYVQKNEMGWLKLNDMPSAFAEALQSVNSRTVSNPVQTQNGFHVLNVADLRSTEGPEVEPDRKQIEQSIMKRKFAEAIQNWVSKLRGQAFIVANK